MIYQLRSQINIETKYLFYTTYFILSYHYLLNEECEITMTEEKNTIQVINNTITAIENIKGSLQKAKEELKQLEEDKEHLSNEKSLLEREKQQLEDETKKLEQEKEALEEEKQKLEQEKIQLEEETKQLEKEKQERDQKIGALTAEQKKLLKEYESLKEELKKLSKIVADKEEEEFNIDRIKALLSIYNVLLRDIWQGQPHFRILMLLHGDKEQMTREEIKMTTGISGAMVLHALHELENIDLLEYNEDNNIVQLKKRLFERGNVSL
ncbi:MAG: hypothetical protein BAJALOKI1v1_1120008 [Promethearchaeota archaeon]|nr:MAG: hypothetical protein BAJALOKI1v1_1120008 [Candidatus Lokiarchaeota archaeon]